MTRPLFDVPPINNGACAKPLARIHTMQPRERYEAGQEIDRVFFAPAWPGRPTTRVLVDPDAEAKKICGICPELLTCREWTLDREIELGVLEEGVRGGLDQEQRAVLVRKAREAVA